MVRIIGHGAVELGGQHHIVASTTGQGFAEDHFRLPTGAAVGGVDEGDASVEGLVDHLDGGVVVGIAQTPNIVAPRQSRLTVTPVLPKILYCTTHSSGWRGTCRCFGGRHVVRERAVAAATLTRWWR